MKFTTSLTKFALTFIAIALLVIEVVATCIQDTQLSLRGLPLVPILFNGNISGIPVIASGTAEIYAQVAANNPLLKNPDAIDASEFELVIGDKVGDMTFCSFNR